jgi:transposase-like protein
MAEMYVQGVSTCKVKNILEKMCGLEVSSSQVSDAAKTLDEEIRLFKENRGKERDCKDHAQHLLPR